MNKYVNMLTQTKTHVNRHLYNNACHHSMFDSLKVKKQKRKKKLINQSMQKMKTGENKALPPHIPVKGQKYAFFQWFCFLFCCLLHALID